MILKSTYDSFDEIPEWARTQNLYKQEGAKWVIKHEEIEGIAAVTNPGLEKNRNDIREELVVEKEKSKTFENRALKAETEVETSKSKITLAEAKAANADSAVADANRLKEEAEVRANSLTTELNKVKQPDAVVLSKKDHENFRKYTELGTPEEIQTLKTEHQTLGAEVAVSKFEKSLQKATEKSGINYEVALDLFQNRAKGSHLETETNKVKNEKNEEVDEITSYVVTPGKTADEKAQKVVLNDWLEQNEIPTYIKSSLFVEGSDAGKTTTNGNGAGAGKVPEKKFIKVPAFSGKRSGENSADEQLDVDTQIKTMNDNRNTRPSPFASVEHQKQQGQQ